ncbi:hypothetical protein VTP01DRAFT_2411 [Rhizomucor pusillus]|uniref:uncharacterized protein n=1 Tax=Rhizomucor pusillus TaxID=4840 RepID=UPI003741EB11
MFRFSQSCRVLAIAAARTAKRPIACRQYASVARPAVKLHNSKFAAFAVSAVLAGTAYYAWQMNHPVMAEAAAAATAYEGTVEEPHTKLAFPVYLQTGSEWTRLVGLGVRQVSFLNLNVYVVGLYMKSQDIGAVRQLKGFEKFNKSEFLAKEDLALELLKQPVDVSIRIVPVRSTNTQHLRDGFTRSLLQRMHNQSEDMTEEQEREIMKAIQEFKSNFPSAKVKKGAEFVFTKNRDGYLEMEFEGKQMGTVKNTWLAINFFMGYLNPTQPASEYARQSIADGFQELFK